MATSIEVTIRTFDEIPAPIAGKTIEHGSSPPDNAVLPDDEADNEGGIKL